MLVDRIERHDVVNAALLAAVLLLLGFGIISAVDRFFNTVDEGLVVTSKAPETADPASAAAESGSGDAALGPAVSVDGARAPAEVTVQVLNGADERPGVAGAGTDVLQAAGYTTLPPENGPTRDDSIAYYLEGYEADATAVAGLLGFSSSLIEPMPDDPTLPVNDAKVLVILGISSDF